VVQGVGQILLRHTDEDGASRRYTINGGTAKDARDKAGAIRKRHRPISQPGIAR
jgi:hypothetical protein